MPSLAAREGKPMLSLAAREGKPMPSLAAREIRPKRSRIIREEYEVSRRRNEDDTKELKNLIILD